MKKLSVFGCLCLAVSFIGLPAMAQTPDGETPANEGVCDELQADGTTKGLYGLCVAFCEAQDCEATVDEATGEVTFDESCRASNPKLLDNYTKRMKTSDPYLPCVNVIPAECPCWTEQEMDTIADGPGAKCGLRGENTFIKGFDAMTGAAERAGSVYDSLDLNYYCSYQARNPHIQRYMEISAAEHQVCSDSVIAECASR